MNDDPKPSNPRAQRKQSDKRLLLLVIFTLVVVGGTIIALIYGWQSLFTALPILIAGAGLTLVPWLVLTLLQKWRESMDS